MACGISSSLLTQGYGENLEWVEIAEWVDVWEHRNFRLSETTRKAIIETTVIHAKGGPYQSFEGEVMRKPMSAWRLSGVVCDVLDALKNGGHLQPVANPSEA